MQPQHDDTAGVRGHVVGGACHCAQVEGLAAPGQVGTGAEGPSLPRHDDPSDPVIGVHRTWLSSNIKPGVIWSNTQGYSNPKVDQLLGDAGKEMNLAKRKALYKEAQKIIVDDCPVAFIFEARGVEAYRSNVVNPPKGIWGLVDAVNDMGVRKA